MLQSGRVTLRSGKVTTISRRKTMKMPTSLQPVVEQIKQRAMQLWLDIGPEWRLALLTIVAVSCVSFFLILLGGCAATPQAAPVIQQCRVPTAPLQKTPEPQMRDATTEELSDTELEVRRALRLCNADKLGIKKWIEDRQ
jgi:UDP:flavonoid glycosyltransferase YjiC (YdhE family)